MWLRSLLYSDFTHMTEEFVYKHIGYKTQLRVARASVLQQIMSNKTIEFLYKAADALPGDNRTQLLLKSFYLYVSQPEKHSLCFHFHSRLPISYNRTRSGAHGAHQFTTGQRTTPDGDAADACRRCATKYQHKQFRLQLMPSSQRGRRARRLVQRNESRHESAALSTSQRILAKKFLKTVSTVAVSDRNNFV